MPESTAAHSMTTVETETRTLDADDAWNNTDHVVCCRVVERPMIAFCGYDASDDPMATDMDMDTDHICPLCYDVAASTPWAHCPTDGTPCPRDFIR